MTAAFAMTFAQVQSTGIDLMYFTFIDGQLVDNNPRLVMKEMIVKSDDQVTAKKSSTYTDRYLQQQAQEWMWKG